MNFCHRGAVTICICNILSPCHNHCHHMSHSRARRQCQLLAGSRGWLVVTDYCVWALSSERRAANHRSCSHPCWAGWEVPIKGKLPWKLGATTNNGIDPGVPSCHESTNFYAMWISSGSLLHTLPLAHMNRIFGSLCRLFHSSLQFTVP